MELLQLKYFQCVAKYENVTKAATRLHISQPSLSTTIKRLEEELGIPLFNRTGKNIELNDFGKIFLSHTNKILTEIENAKSEVLELAGIKSTHLSISATASYFFSGVLAKFLTNNPNITLTQSITNPTKAVQKLKLGVLDFVISSPPINDPDIETIELFKEDIVVVVPNSNKFSKRKKLRLEELKNESFIELTENYAFRSTTEKMYNAAGFTPKILFQGDADIMSELIDAQKGLVLVPKSLCTISDDRPCKMIELEDTSRTRTITLSYLKGKYLSEVSKSFKDFIIDYYKK